MVVKLLGNQEVPQVECFVIHSIGSLGSFRRNRVGRKGGGRVQREGKKCGNIKVNYS